MWKVFFPLLITLIIGIFVIRNVESGVSLRQAIIQSLDGATGKYAIVVKDLKNGKTASLDGDKVYEMGSLYKLWIMATAFQQIQNGILSEDEVLSRDVKDLNDEFGIDPQAAELTDGIITISVKNALKQMITISHNYSALMLTEKVKLSNVAKFLQINGFKNSHVGDTPTSTSYDIALFFEKLYKGELANEKYTQEMLGLLKAQKLIDKLPKLLPSGTVVAHKTGEIDYLSHDAGIVYTQNGNYIIVVLSESDYPPGAEERIAQISKAVFDYFLSQE